MSKTEAQRQKKLAKKRAKDSIRHDRIKTEKQLLISGAGKMLAASRGKILECHMSTPGPGMVIVTLTRQGPNGLVGYANFLLDTWCLGVKDCDFRLESPQIIRQQIEKISERFETVAIEPGLGRAIVEGAIEFASSYGFAPHPDYNKASLLWGDIPVQDLPADFQFGQGGKALYVPGPYEDFHQQRAIMEKLSRSSLESNFLESED